MWKLLRGTVYVVVCMEDGGVLVQHSLRIVKPQQIRHISHF